MRDGDNFRAQKITPDIKTSGVMDCLVFDSVDGNAEVFLAMADFLVEVFASAEILNLNLFALNYRFLGRGFE